MKDQIQILNTKSFCKYNLSLFFKDNYINSRTSRKKIKINELITVKELANMIKVPVTEVISYCIYIGVIVKINHWLDAELVTLVANEFGYDIEFMRKDLLYEKNESNLRIRSPIVGVFGHVNHGKSSLLDYIRKRNVIFKESGGITQNIAAYNVKFKYSSMTFIDTPGHESFSYMRSIVTKLTDIAIIIIDADEQVMPQTREAIHYALYAGVRIIFALNKIDKDTANPDKIREQLANMNLLVDEWGGDYPSQEISSKYGFGIKNLLAKILLEAEMLNLKVNFSQPASGTVISAHFDPSRGAVTTIIVQYGSIKQGDYIIVGDHSGKIKSMYDEFGKVIRVAIPSEPVIIYGLSGVPLAGETFEVVKNKKLIKNIPHEEKIFIKNHINLVNIVKKNILGYFKELKIILKVDVHCTIEALIKSIKKLYNENVYINIIYKGVGQITESDIILARTYNSIIIGFNVSTNLISKNIYEKENIEVRTYYVIYDVIKYIKKHIEDMYFHEEGNKLIGKAEIREIYKIPKLGNIAGCMVIYGKIISSSHVKLLRNGIIIYEGKLGSLKRFKENVQEVSKGYECGLNLISYNNIKIGDIIEVYAS
jgi:translation initiation factor IF-2